MAAESKIIKMIINAENKASRVFSDVDKSIGTLDSSFGGLGGRADRLTKSIGLVTAAVGAMAVAFAVFAGKEAAEFETAIANINTLLWGEQEKDLPAIQKGIMAMTRDIPQAASVLAAAGYTIQSGLGAGAKGLDVLEEAAKAAVAGLTDAQTSSGLMVTVMAAYKMEMEKAAYVSDVMFGVVKEGQLNYENLAAGIGKIAGPGAMANQSLEQIGAALATLTVVTGQQEESFTKLGRGLDKLQMPGVQRKFREMGVETLDATGKLIPLSEIIAQISQKELTYAQIMEAVPMERAAKGIALLSQNYGLLSQKLDSVTNSQGAADKAFKKMMDTRANEIRLAQNAWKEFLVVIGDPLLKAISPLIGDIVVKLHGISDWEKESGAISGVFTTWILALAEVVKILPGVLDALVGIDGQAGKTGQGFLTWAGDIETAKGLLSGTVSVVGGLVLSVAMIRDAFVAVGTPIALALLGPLYVAGSQIKNILQMLDYIPGINLTGAVASMDTLLKGTWQWGKALVKDEKFWSDDIIKAIAKAQRGLEGITGETKTAKTAAEMLAGAQEKAAGAVAKAVTPAKTENSVTETIENITKANEGVAKLKEALGGLNESHGAMSTAAASMFGSLTKALSSKDTGFMDKITIKSQYEKTTKPWLEMQGKLVDAQVGYINHLKAGGGLDINIKSEGGPAWLNGLTDDLLEKVVIKASGEGVKALVGIS